ncbi:transferring glycosyl group transferase [Senna tora]|uniref:Transferring glycosyl group transferase n=1 Tax=Senna tora TaxID=362788 RepID=A0A834SWT6_9FABA|nr:transferring glycosyl group transferase [Senna tora]
MADVRWFVMGDDDTVFVAENLVRVLRKYDHTQFYYIGSLSESHLQNIFFSYGMAYGGGGFAISYPLAKALCEMQDRCIQRYPALYGSDDRMQACMAELGVPLTKELGFHQYDVYGNLLGLLAAHPVTPLVSLHHLDVVEPIFPNLTRLQALQKLTIPMRLDSAGLMQQSICYDKARGWTISVSWGFVVLIFRGVFSPREMEMPSRTFLNWYRRADYTAYAFNTRPVTRNPCQKPFVFYFSSGELNSSSLSEEEGIIVSEYRRHRVAQPECRWRMPDPSAIDVVKVYKKPDPYLWDRAPRRNCCRVMTSKENGSMVVDVGVCKEGELAFVVPLAQQLTLTSAGSAAGSVWLRNWLCCPLAPQLALFGSVAGWLRNWLRLAPLSVGSATGSVACWLHNWLRLAPLPVGSATGSVARWLRNFVHSQRPTGWVGPSALCQVV